jgi:hypothetical protein
MKFQFLISFLLIFASAQNHPELNWQTIETNHFFIHFHNESERSAREASTVAEYIYPAITEMYQFEPDSKTHIIIKDTDDYANGAAYYYDNKIEIWAMPLDFDLRGSHRWMQNVITHEFTHIIQIGASMKYNRHFPGTYLQMMGYEDEKREDVLYGYPNVIISYPIPGTAVPPWLAEGTAQFMYPGANFDYLDSHRDMIIRDRVLNNNLLSFSQMNTFGKRGIGNESIYNQGFAFVSYLANRFGEDVLRKISVSLSKPFNYSIRKAMKDATGIDGVDLYKDWANELAMSYKSKTEHILQNTQTGELLENEGTTNIHPVWSPDNSKFAFLSNKDNDYFGQTDLFIYDFETSTSEKVAGGAQTAPTWVNDSTIIYAKKSKPNKNGSKYFDLYKINLMSEDEERLTTNSRLRSPVYHVKSNQIAAIRSYDGTSNILVSDADSINFMPITNFTDGIQMASLSWKDDLMMVDAVYHHNRNIYSVNIEIGKLEMIQSDNGDCRDMIMHKDVHVFATDRSGIFNLFQEDKGYLTNVLGGAFMPNVSDDNRILYSLYENGQYNIAILETPIVVTDSNVGYSINEYRNRPTSLLITNPNDSPTTPYKDTMPKPFILPRIMYDYGTIKPGFYFYANDVLDKLSVFGGASINKLADKDLFLMFEFKKFTPTFYTTLYWITRNITQSSVFYDINYSNDDFSIQLFASDIGVRFPIKNEHFWIEFNYAKYRQSFNTIIFNEHNQVVAQGGYGFDYLSSKAIKFKWNHKRIKSEFAGKMLPSNGYEIQSCMSYELNGLIDGFSFNDDYGTYDEILVENNTARIELDIDKHWTFNHKNKIVGSIDMHVGWLSNYEIDNYFYFMGGGLPGIKGYTYFDSTMTGPTKTILTTSLRLPLFIEKNITIAHYNITNFSIGFITQVGGAYKGQILDYLIDNNYQLSSGIELRLSGYSFYAYPTAISYEYHKPPFDNAQDAKHYLTILFDF